PPPRREVARDARGRETAPPGEGDHRFGAKSQAGERIWPDGTADLDRGAEEGDGRGEEAGEAAGRAPTRRRAHSARPLGDGGAGGAGDAPCWATRRTLRDERFHAPALAREAPRLGEAITKEGNAARRIEGAAKNIPALPKIAAAKEYEGSWKRGESLPSVVRN